jgi:RimJ/RimL family protein N-acetyltransferase
MTGTVRALATMASAMAGATTVISPGRSTRLDGPRIYIRELRADDANACVHAARLSRRLHGRWVRPPLTVDDFIARMQTRKFFSNSVSLVARRRDDDAVIGQFNLSEIIRGPLQQAFLGYAGAITNGGRSTPKYGARIAARRDE